MGDVKLTEKQKRFADEYLIDLNATKAAIRAGYSEKTANEQGNRLLVNVSVKDYIQHRMKDREKRTEITQDWVLNTLKEIAERCMEKVPVMEKDSNGNLVPSGQWKFDSAGANRAVELVGKHFKMFTDKTDVNISIDKKLEDFLK
jgi:phage terminase small subunit